MTQVGQITSDQTTTHTANFHNEEVYSTEGKYTTQTVLPDLTATKKYKTQRESQYSIKDDDLQLELQRWFGIQGDTTKTKLWWEKLQKIALKLKDPEEENRLRTKIEQFLKTAPSAFSDYDEGKIEFRRQLPNYIIDKLKEMYLQSTNVIVDECRTNIPKYYSRYKTKLLKTELRCWLKNIQLKKKDYLDRVVNKNDVFKHIFDKLEPLVLDRPKNDSAYFDTLTKIITDIVQDLPIANDSENKEHYLEKIAVTLVNNIINIDARIPVTYIQPTVAEIKYFAKEQITYILEKSGTAISTKKTERLETELTNQLLDLIDVKDIDSCVDNIKNILIQIAKIPEGKAKYFTNIIVTDYKEFFFRQHYFNVKENTKLQPVVCSEIMNNSSIPLSNNETNDEEEYKQRLHDVIDEWLTNMKIPINDQSLKENILKRIGSDITYRFRYLQNNPHSIGTSLEELELLKYQIFKRTRCLGSECNNITIDNIKELMKHVQQITIPVPLKAHSKHSISLTRKSKDRAYSDIMIDEIWGWFQKLPTDIIQNLGLSHPNKKLIQYSAAHIGKNINNKDFETIDKELDDWVRYMFNGNLRDTYVKELKNKINNMLNFNKYLDKKLKTDPKQEKCLIRNYEDIIDEWIDSITLDKIMVHRFLTIRNKVVHEMAVKLYDIKFKLGTHDVNQELQNAILYFWDTLPLDLQFRKINNRDEYAGKLLKAIETGNIDSTVRTYGSMGSTRKSTENPDKSVTRKLESVLFEWLRQLSYERNQNRISLEYTINQFAIDLQRTIDNGDNIDDTISEYFNKLEINQSKEFYLDASLQLKRSLYHSNVLDNLLLNSRSEHELLVANIEEWLNQLPIYLTDVDHFQTKKNKFVATMEQFRTLHLNDEIIIKEIIKFIKSLPIETSSKQSEKYLYDKAYNLIRSIEVNAKYKENKFKRHAVVKYVGEAIKEWAKLLPIEPEYNPRELKQVIDEMTTVISSILNDSKWELIANQNDQIKQEVLKYLKKLPLKKECKSEQRESNITNNLTRKLNDQLNCTFNLNSGDINRNNVTVYGVSVKNTSNEFNVRSMNADMNTNLETYTNQVIHEISDWLNSLDLQINQDKGFQNVVINDLASDIVDRYKYLLLNTQSSKSPEEEIEQLRYQIFKWINKLVGDENIDTIAHADGLMQRIQSIPKPLLTKSQNIPRDSLADLRKRMSNKLLVTKQDVDRLPSYGQATGGGSFRGKSTRSQFKRMSSPGALAIPKSPKMQSQYSATHQNPQSAIFDKYEKIFKEKIYDLPIDTSTPESAQLAQLARTAMYNGLMKIFFRLKTDPDIENDYGYFELILEDKLDEMLDLLPQTEEMQRSRQAFKVGILINAMQMLKDMQAISDRPSFKQRLKDGFNRKFAKDIELEQCFLLQQGILSKMAEDYILETKYREEDPLKANIYKQRLMKRVNEVANHLTRQHNTPFKFLSQPVLLQEVMKALTSVPLPEDNILEEEVAEILLAEEIEKWYKELPIEPYHNNLDEILIKRMIELLSRKLCEIERNVDELDTSKERQMKHEMSRFLEKRGKLQPGEDLNINFMVDELVNRIKNMKLNDISYGAFEKDKPVCSTLVEIDNAEIFAPLIDPPSAVEHYTRISLQAPNRTSPEVQTDLAQAHVPVIGPQNQSNFLPNMCPGSNITINQSVRYQAPMQSDQYVQDGDLQLHGIKYSSQINQSAAPIPQAELQNQGLNVSQRDRSNVGSNQPGPMQAYNNQQFTREPDILRPGSPTSTPFEVKIPNLMNQTGTRTSRPSPTSVQSTTLRPSQIGPSYADSPNAPTQNNMVSRATSPQAHASQQGLPSVRSPLSGSLFRPNLHASQFRPNNEYSQRQTVQSPVFVSRPVENMQGVHRSPRRRLDFDNEEIIQDYVHEERLRSHPGNIRICRNFPAALGIPCPSYADGREDEEESRERIIIKCRCMERLRRRRHVCLNSLPCPEFRSPCRYYYN